MLYAGSCGTIGNEGVGERYGAHRYLRTRGNNYASIHGDRVVVGSCTFITNPREILRCFSFAIARLDMAYKA